MSPTSLKKACQSPYYCPNLVEAGEKYCKACRAKEQSRKSITIVCGPPSSGKSAYVFKQARPGDLIVDLDLIWQALSGMPRNERPMELFPFVLAVRDELYRQLEKPNEIERAWIIAGLPTAKEREHLSKRLGGKIVLLKVQAEECMKRITNDGKRKDKDIERYWKPMIDKWWKLYEPSDKDEVIE